MQAMADCGCLELRFGIESGSERILKEIKKGFDIAAVLELIPRAIEIFPCVDVFYVWGFPFETMDDFVSYDGCEDSAEPFVDAAAGGDL